MRPSQPMGPIVVLNTTATSATISWNPPLDSGGADALSYSIQAQEIDLIDGKILQTQSYFASSTSFTVDGLKTGRFYRFKINAQNESGISDESLMGKKPLKIKCKMEKPSAPGTPRIVFVDDENGMVELEWTKSDLDGVDYTIERRNAMADSNHWVKVNANTVQIASYVASNLLPGVAYEFRVSAENTAGISLPSKSSDLVVLKTIQKSDPPVIVKSLQDITAVEGTDVMFRVNVTVDAIPEFTWYRDKVVLWNGKKSHIVSSITESQLTLTSVELDDDGEILCKISNKDGTVKTGANLIVETPPKIAIPPMCEECSMYDKGESIRFKLGLTSRPSPVLEWTVNGRQIEADFQHEIQLDDDCIILRIKDANKIHSGTHLIKAENKHGAHNVQFNVLITDVPDPPSCPSVTNISIDSCDLKWEQPQNDGGGTINKYIVEQSELGSNIWTNKETVRTNWIALTNLNTGKKELIFRVKAVNIYGASEPSEECRVCLQSPESSDPDLVVAHERNLGHEPFQLATCLEDSFHLPSLDDLDLHFNSSSSESSDDSDSDHFDDTMLASQSVNSGAEKKGRTVVRSKATKDVPGTPRARRVARNAVLNQSSNPFLDMGSEVEFRSRFRVCEKIGRGAFTVVHRCYEKKSRQQYAARFIRIGRDLGTKEMVFRELEIMHVCQHERLVTFYEAYDLGSYVVMILEYIPNGELADKIVREDPRMTEEDCRQVARQICEGIGFLHRNSIVHLDLKPENVLCMSSESNDVKLIDFGLARRLDPFAGIRILFATPEFCAPEVVNYETVGFPTDMWSIGVITFVMLSGTSPFLGEDDDETLTNVSDASWDFQEDCWENISFEAKDFITRLLVKAKDGRLTIEDALRHPWIQGRKCLPESKATSYLQLKKQETETFITTKKEVVWTLTTRKK